MTGLTGWWAAAMLQVAVAGAPKVYVNGERADGLRDVVLEEVDVRIDAKGNLWISAPQYRIGGVGGESAQEPAPAGQYWLVVDDHASKGLSIDVQINGRAVRTISSGAAPAPLDLAPWLHRGANQVVLSAAASSTREGGPLVLRIGSGADAGSLDPSAVSFARDPSTAQAPLERSFVVRVP